MLSEETLGRNLANEMIAHRASLREVAVRIHEQCARCVFFMCSRGHGLSITYVYITIIRIDIRHIIGDGNNHMDIKITETEDTTRVEPKARTVWENLQYAVLALTIFGQITVGPAYLVGQGGWFVANVVAFVRDFALSRPTADKVKDAAMIALTLGLATAHILGAF